LPSPLPPFRTEIDPQLERVRRLEHHDPPGGDRHLPTGFRIAADALAFFAVAASSTRSCSKRTTCPLLVKGSTGTTGKEWPFLANALISQGIYRQATFRAERAVPKSKPSPVAERQ
jgi:hypothetical protein